MRLRLWVLCGSAVAWSVFASAEAPRDGQRDFDFEIGSWKTQLRRLTRPLTGSGAWVEYEGTSVVRPVWGGRANLVELDVAGPAGRIEGLSLRLYDPLAHTWSLNFANARSGALSPPVVGAFRDDRGEFFGEETLDGRPIRVRFVISDVTATSCRFEQAFSADGGKTWEVNWIAIDTRVGTTAARNDPSSLAPAIDPRPSRHLGDPSMTSRAGEYGAVTRLSRTSTHLGLTLHGRGP